MYLRQLHHAQDNGNVSGETEGKSLFYPEISGFSYC